MGCGLTLDFGPRGSDAGAGADARPRRDAEVMPACAEYTPFEPPRKLGLSDDSIEWSVTISSDGLELFFVRTGEVENTGLRRAVRTSRADDFATDTPVDLDLTFVPDNPSLSIDGTKLFLDGFPDATNIWVVERADPGAPFGPERLALTGAAPPFVIAGPDVAFDGSSLLLGTTDIHIAPASAGGTFAPDPAQIDALSDPTVVEGWPAWGPAGSIVFAREGDLLLATPNGTDYDVVDLAPLNTDSEESDPDMTPDGRTIVFASRRAMGTPDLYIADRACAR
jgi:hypothetical protein